MLAVIFPRQDDRAIEERYAAWQSELCLRRDTPRSQWFRADFSAPAAEAAREISDELTLVVTTPLILPAPGIVDLLRASLDENADAAVPVTNFPTTAEQHRPPEQIYLTLRQFEDVARTYAGSDEPLQRLTWGDADPTMFLTSTSLLRASRQPLRAFLDGRRVIVNPRAYVHRYAAHRGQFRADLLDLIDTGAKSILEFGCGEGALGEAIKRRQPCKVVGIELDPQAAAIARKRLDAVHEGDVREIIENTSEKFDFIVGGDILEHLDDPWTFLGKLRNLVTRDGKLLLSLPNISAWPLVADLLRGRFDYVYMGILCAGHVRFFTKQTVRDMLAISGWHEVRLTDQEHFVTSEYESLVRALEAGGVPHSREDLLPAGHYVLARANPPDTSRSSG